MGGRFSAQLLNHGIYAEVPMKYNERRGARKGFSWWMVVSVIFMLLSAFLAFVAWHNAKPLECDYKYLDNSKLICERELK